MHQKKYEMIKKYLNNLADKHNLSRPKVKATVHINADGYIREDIHIYTYNGLESYFEYSDEFRDIVGDFYFELERPGHYFVYHWTDDIDESELKKKNNLPLEARKKLKTTIKNAIRAAKSSITSDDGGSCNLDYVWLKIDGGINVAKEIIDEAGLIVSIKDPYLHILPPGAYQGWNRTRQCEAMAKVLRDAGYSAGVSYVMD